MADCYIPLLQTGGGKGVLGPIANVVLRGNVFHFRRTIPLEIRHRLKKRELTCSLRTREPRDAKVASKALYVASEFLFQTARTVPMLSEEQLSVIVKDFYATVVGRENALRLNGRHLTEEARQARIAYFQQVADQARLLLARNQFDDAAFVAETMTRTHKRERPLNHVERKQVQQALLRACIDLAENMKSRYEGDFNYDPRDKLLTSSDSVSITPQVEQQAPAPKGPLFSEAAKKFVSSQLQSKAWEHQTANQAEKTFKLFREINGDLPIDAYTREHAGRQFKTSERAARYVDGGRAPDTVQHTRLAWLQVCSVSRN